MKYLKELCENVGFLDGVVYYCGGGFFSFGFVVYLVLEFYGGFVGVDFQDGGNFGVGDYFCVFVVVRDDCCFRLCVCGIIYVCFFGWGYFFGFGVFMGMVVFVFCVVGFFML